jgi:rhodanese-related sulfurtransferase
MILALVFLILAGGLLLLPKHEKHEGISPQFLLNNMISPERYISPDDLAQKIINNDPSFLLIDVRDKVRFQEYSIPNAINIPIDKLLEEESLVYLDQDQYDVIFFSNDHFYADQAWMICNRLGFKNHRVLKGGVNLWFSTIINPQKPKENMPASEFEQYSFRKAASMYFGVQYPEDINIDQTKKKVVPKKVVPVKKKKKLPVEGGC